MRPEILNPLFAEVEALKGVGAALTKPLARLGLARVVDLLFHLPTGMIRRQRVEKLDDAPAGGNLVVEVTPVDYRQSPGRGPFRVYATDSAGDYLSLVFFGGHPSYAKKLLPLGEKRIVSGRVELYGQERQMVHPDHVFEPKDAGKLSMQEAVYALSEGVTSRRLGQLVEQGMARAPKLPEWIEPSLLARRTWLDWRSALETAHREPYDSDARDRLAYDELFANQLALMLVRASTRKRKAMGACAIGSSCPTRQPTHKSAPSARLRAISRNPHR
jgi:ATP-dependent DNA helicase RecG